MHKLNVKIDLREIDMTQIYWTSLSWIHPSFNKSGTFVKKVKTVSDSKGSEKQENLKIKKLLDDLNSGSAKKVSAALKALQVHGKVSILKPIVETLKAESTPAESKAEIIEFLSSLKVTNAAPEIIDILRDEKFISVRQLVLSTIWNSKVDYSDYIADFVAIAVEGDFMEALECLTIIENLEGPFQETQILESQLHLRDYAESTETKNEQKAKIMSEIALLIKDFDLQIDDY